ncbi:MAG: zinc-ribbon domain-containing protein [Nanoarchaeota archaeon]|nr:zinc-ribbon domain-containing protein [Nanoarchaeota archaeon]
MKCSKCGKKNKPDDDFCAKCGHRLKKEVKKITVRSILAWIFGILFILVGATSFSDSFFGGFLIVLGGLIILPPVGDMIRNKFHIELSGWLKFIAFLILVGIGISLTQSAEKKTIEIQPTERVQEETLPETTQSKATEPEPEPEPEPPKPKPTPVKKVKSATLTIDRVQIQVANLYPTRVTVTNTGDVTIYTKFDIYVYDDNGKEVCAGSPMLSDPSSVSVGEKETGELLMMGCSFDKDGTYTLKIDLLDTDYNKLDTKTKDFTIDYWKQFEFNI